MKFCCLQQPEWHHSSLEYILEGQWERGGQCKKVIRAWSDKKICNPWINALLTLDIHCYHMVLFFKQQSRDLKQRNTQMILSWQLSPQSWPTVHHGLHSDPHRKWCSTPVRALVECICGWGKTNNQTSSSAEQKTWNLSYCNATHLWTTLWPRADKQRGSLILSKNRVPFKNSIETNASTWVF